MGLESSSLEPPSTGCLIPANAFYEWKKIDPKTKQPYAFGMNDHSPLAFAGVWERWMAPDNKPVDSFAIITTGPNELAATVHTRMPVILEPRDYTRWLTRAGEQQPPIDLLRPYDADAMKAWCCSRERVEQRPRDAEQRISENLALTAEQYGKVTICKAKQ